MKNIVPTIRSDMKCNVQIVRPCALSLSLSRANHEKTNPIHSKPNRTKQIKKMKAKQRKQKENDSTGFTRLLYLLTLYVVVI